MDAINDLVAGIAAAAVFSALMEIIIAEDDGGYGFRTVCGLAVMLTVVKTVCSVINL